MINVEYFGDPRLTAAYSYQASNEAFANSPLIKTCNDTMYAGAMSKIAYDFAVGRPHGFLWRERYYDGIDPTNGPAVSTLTVPADDTKRIETRGDGPSRTFTYENELGLLKSWTDFKGQLSSQDHFPTGFVSYVRDARGNQTDFVRDPITGKITQIIHPLTPSDVNGRATRAFGYDPNHPYHVASVTNERQYTTTYYRDSDTAEITDIVYPDYHFTPPVYFGHEGFLYDDFGRVTRHQRQNANFEHLQYDGRGLLVYSWNPRASATAPAAPTTVAPRTTFEYYLLGHPWQDRVKTVTDPRGKTTTYEYDRLPTNEMYAGRGLVSKVTYHDNKYITFDYDSRGNTLWRENELRERTSYIYDDYNRVVEIKTPLPENRVATTTYAYNPNYSFNTPFQSPYLHTTTAVTRSATPTGIVTENSYNEDFWLRQRIRGAGTAQFATTKYDYDPVGNLVSVIDPREYETTMDYDQRNRRTKVTGPPVSAAENVQYVTQWLYDPASNVREILLPDGNSESRDYDEMNRLLTSDFANYNQQDHRTTVYTYFASGRLKTVQDPRNKITAFEYDERDLQTKLTYPDQTVLQGWQYDENGNIKERPTIGGPKQVFSYDDRNRLKTMRWSNGIDFSDFGYDEVGRLTSAVNPYSTIIRDYDEGGRLSLDRQILASVLNTPSMTIIPTGIVSRKTHAAAGSFDIALPLTGVPGIECRTGSDYSLVLTFADPVSVGGATVNSGIGTVSGVSASANVVTVNLFDVSDAQLLTVRVFGLSDGTSTGELIVPLHILIGDTTADGVVNSDDSETTDRHVDQNTDASNFRSDVNVDGVINNGDVIKVTVTAGFDTPTPPAPGPQADVLYHYDDDGKLETLLTPADAYEYLYDGLGRLEWIRRLGNSQVAYQYAYDRSSNVIGRTSYTNDTSLSFARDEVNRLTEETILLGTDTFSHLHYKYDAMNRLRSTFREEDGLLDSFSYSFTGELIYPQYGLQANGQGGFENPENVGSYVYDNAGNRLSVNGVTYAPNTLNQYTHAEGAAVGNGSQHEITSYQGVNYSYLADTRLANVQSNTGGVYQLGYDALGRTVRRTTNGQASYFIYDGARSIIEYNGAGSMVASTVYGLGADEIIARNNNGAGQFFLHDRMDNTVAVTGWKGELLEQYRYDAFGKPKIMGSNGELLEETKINNNLLFNGREWVSRFGFYENRARAYHPGLGRFMSEDPLGFAGGDNNLFRYCGNDPLNFSDPSGGPRVTKKKDGNDGDTTGEVVVSASGIDPTPNDRGFIDANAIGGLNFLGMSGGGIRGGGASGVRRGAPDVEKRAAA